MKNFEILEETGSNSVRKHVFRRMLEEESNASRPGSRDQSRVNQQNYSLQIVGTELINGRPAFVIEAQPKQESKYLIAGRIWVDHEDYAIVRVEGKPAKNPSFWTRTVHFVHTYDRLGSFWFPSSNKSVTDVSVFGKAEMTIEYFDYQHFPIER